MRKTRPSADELFSFVDEFVAAVQEVFAKCCIHFEDWTGTDAVHLLQRYRDKYCVYNDDVQGTAGITLSGMINSAKLKGTKLKDEKNLFFGAGPPATPPPPPPLSPPFSPRLTPPQTPPPAPH